MDGALVAGSTGITSARSASGYWRWGGTYLTGLTAAPSSNYFVGTLDEIAVYNTQLTDLQISKHYYANF